MLPKRSSWAVSGKFGAPLVACWSGRELSKETNHASPNLWGVIFAKSVLVSSRAYVLSATDLSITVTLRSFLVSVVAIVLWAGFRDLNRSAMDSELHQLFSPKISFRELFDPVRGRRWILLDYWRLAILISVLRTHLFNWPIMSKAFPVLGCSLSSWCN